MSQPLKEILLGRFDKNQVIDLVNQDQEAFRNILEFTLGDEEKLGWRAAWVLYHATEERDIRLTHHIPSLIDAIRDKKDGHQRELLRTILKQHPGEEKEGELFDICMGIWEQIGKIPSTRLFAFRVMLTIAKRYPELNTELGFMVQDHYTETLSPGIRKSLIKMVAKPPYKQK